MADQKPRFIRKVTEHYVLPFTEALAKRKDMVECDRDGKIIGNIPEQATTPATTPAPATDKQSVDLSDTVMVDTPAPEVVEPRPPLNPKEAPSQIGPPELMKQLAKQQGFLEEQTGEAIDELKGEIDGLKSQLSDLVQMLKTITAPPAPAEAPKPRRKSTRKRSTKAKAPVEANDAAPTEDAKE